MSSIYHDILLDHYKNPRNFGNLKNANKKTTISNPVCGDKINMMVLIKNNKVNDIKFKGEGCVISTASTSLLTEYVKNKPLTAFCKKAMRDKKTAYIVTLDEDFILKMLNIHIGPVRLKCALLPLEALKKLLKN
ncbi:SUF system NifU family Fe-S cluster assembly protein [Patescibacteria group bacterium AH-259-L05]|nr:SUF system NifU family Fe-S cluster assembly protein [Patescibacteria group bacterium AH-259-L05]